MKKLTIDQYKVIVLDIMLRIDRICRENDIRYFIAYGTLLGAVRHQGFIPWDDDMDIGMLREDYEKLRTIINSGDYGLFFIDIETVPETIYPYGKICDTNTVMYEKNFRNVPHYGAFVDVFPFDYVPENDIEWHKFNDKAMKMVKILTHASRTGYERTSSFSLNVKRFIAQKSAQIINVHNMIEKLDKDFRKYNDRPTSKIGLPWSMNRKCFDYDDIFPLSEVTFEGHSLLGPGKYDQVLTKMYGDYMKLPPENERVNKHQLDCYYK